jgi:hypothetical protein
LHHPLTVWPHCLPHHRVGMKEGDEEDAECATCRSLMHTAALECDCCPGRHVCLYHSDTLCECKGDKHRLLYR